MNLGELKKRLSEFENDDLEVLVTTGEYHESLYSVELIKERLSKNPDVKPYEFILIVG